MLNPSFRIANCDEIRIISDLTLKALPDDFSGILSSDEIDFMLERLYSQEILQNAKESGRIYIIAKIEGKDVGVGSFIQEGPDLFFMGKIHVLPEYRENGAGSAIFQAVCAEIKKLHPAPCKVELMANHSNTALDFYKKLGLKYERDEIFDLESFELSEQIYSIEIWNEIKMHISRSCVHFNSSAVLSFAFVRTN